jgi:hypothetical protein
VQQAQARKRQCVFGAQLVRARRFYGYADGESVFVKITLYNPRDVSKVADLLRVSVPPYKSAPPARDGSCR